MCATLQIWCLSWNHLMRLSCSKLVRFTQVHSEPKIWYPQWRFHNLFTEKKGGSYVEMNFPTFQLCSCPWWGEGDWPIIPLILLVLLAFSPPSAISPDLQSSLSSLLCISSQLQFEIISPDWLKPSGTLGAHPLQSGSHSEIIVLNFRKIHSLPEQVRLVLV